MLFSEISLKEKGLQTYFSMTGIVIVFPAMGSLVFYGFLIYLLVKSPVAYWYKFIICSFFIVLIFLVVLSRIYLGVHYITDIIAGCMAGFASLTVCIAT